MDLRSERKHSWKVREQQEPKIEKYWQVSKKRYGYMYTLHKAFSLSMCCCRLNSKYKATECQLPTVIEWIE